MPIAKPSRFVPLFALLTSTAIAAGPATTRPATRAAAKPVRVACVGDSITAGATIHDPRHNGYPAQLERMLGAGFTVGNFGNSGSTLLAHGDKPYVQQKEYAAAVADHADVVVIALGTNDSKPQNWSHASEFAGDYAALIAAFRKGNPDVKVYVCVPPPSFPGFWGIREQVMVDEVAPAVRRVAADNNAAVIDLHEPLTGAQRDFKDTVHPNAAGAALLAHAVYEAIRTD